MNISKLLSTRVRNIKINPFLEDLTAQKNFLHSQINDKKILIIGGAGTIGSSYIKQILKYKPSKITVVDINENGLTELTRDLRKDKISVEALIKNNVYGAIKLLNLCQLNPPKYFFSVSTDKAANPVNIMGASKSLMEKLILSKKNNFRVSTARFANVAFSNGSLLDGFIYRLNKKQPLSCPSDIKRFFVTPEQSGQICLLATFLGDSGNIFFPKLDFHKDQIYFKDIALDYLKEEGFEPIYMNSEKEAKEYDIENNSGQYPIYFFKTDTSGEKTYEEFYTDEEDYNIKKYNSLGFINTPEVQISFEEVEASFDAIFSNSKSEKLDIIKVIKKYVPDFMHIETGKHLDQKM